MSAVPRRARESEAAREGVQGTGQETEDAARYIGDMCPELRNVAADAGLDMLAMILDMAVEEAGERSGGRK